MSVDYSEYEVQDDGSTVAEAEKPTGTNVRESLAGLPRHGAVENQIAGRQDMLSRGLGNIGRTVSSEQMNPIQRALSPAVGGFQALGGAFQRGEAAIANPVLELQRMGVAPNEEMAKFAGKDYFINPLFAAIEGLKGERLGETGDPYRKMIKNPVVSEAAGIAAGLFTMNAFTGGLASAKIGKKLKGKNISAYDDLADTNLQALGNSIRQIGRNVKDKWKAAVSPFKNNDTVHRSTDVAAKIGNKFADVFEGSITRLNKISKGTDTKLITPSGEKIVRRLTIDELTDLVSDMHTDIQKHVMATLQATGKKPNTAKLYQTVDEVRDMLTKSFPLSVQKQIKGISNEYAKIVPKVNDLTYELGYDAYSKSFDTAKAATLFTSAKEATKRNFIKYLAGIDKNITKYNAKLMLWGKKIKPSKLSTVARIAGGAALGSALGQKLVGKASNIIMPSSEDSGASRGIN